MAGGGGGGGMCGYASGDGESSVDGLDDRGSVDGLSAMIGGGYPSGGGSEYGYGGDADSACGSAEVLGFRVYIVIVISAYSVCIKHTSHTSTERVRGELK